MGRKRIRQIRQSVERPFYLGLPTYEPQFLRYYFCSLAEAFRDDADRSAFARALRAPLPSCYRLNAASPNAAAVAERLSAAVARANARAPISAQRVEWYPGTVVWQLSRDRNDLKRDESFKELHGALLAATEAGAISRQELVSMLPPLLLDVQADDVVLDMCAAPGSKTAQLIELMQARTEGAAVAAGGVVANDVEHGRAWVLAHQIGRLGAPNFIVTNHPGQAFPAIDGGDGRYDTQFYYDKVLADVPCTGDAAVRKLADRMRRWSPLDGPNMHCLQLSLLIRAIELVRPGGLVVYSTCSLNAVENEAVVTEVIRRAARVAPGALELLDVHTRLPGVSTRPGLAQWPVLVYTSDEQRFQNGEYFVEANAEALEPRRSLRRSMFCAERDEMVGVVGIERTARIMPQDMDSGGFYLALFRKNANMPSLHAELRSADVVSTERKVALDARASQGNRKKRSLSKSDRLGFEPLSATDCEELRAEYALSDNFPMELLAKHTSNGRRLFFLSRRLHEFLRANALIRVAYGTAVFSRAKRDDGTPFYRIVNGGAHLIAPFVPTRRHNISLDDLKWLLEASAVVSLNALAAHSPSLAASLRSASPGSQILAYRTERFEEFLTALVGPVSLALMVGKEQIACLRLKYIENAL